MKRKQPEIKTVIFDLGNVLLKFNAKKAAERFAKEAKVPLVKLWTHFFTDPTEKAYTRGEITSHEFYRYAKKSLGFPIGYKKFSYLWNDIFWENPGMEGLLKKLKKRYPLYLISNTNALHFNYIRKKFSTLKYFKRTFPSHRLGYRKPDPAAYKKVLRQIKYRPEETVFVDDVMKFVKGARGVGMHAIQFKTKAKLIKDLKKLGIQV